VSITANVRVNAPVVGSVDDLMVIDSLGGPALAVRVGPAAGWQKIELFRVAVTDGPINVTFALTGLGEAWIDDVGIRPVAVNVGIRPPPVRLRHEEVAPSRRGEPAFDPPPIRP
jgi:hypothetical protein